MKKKNLWCSAHRPTKDQTFELYPLIYLEDIWNDLFLKITNLQEEDDLVHIAKDMVELMKISHPVQIAGSPAFLLILGKVIAYSALFGDLSLDEMNKLVYPGDASFSFSRRESEDIPQPDGSIKKISMFQHEGWIKT